MISWLTSTKSDEPFAQPLNHYRRHGGTGFDADNEGGGRPYTSQYMVDKA